MSNKYKHISDDDLDALFRDAAERYIPQPPPQGAWDHFMMQKRLAIIEKEKPIIKEPTNKLWLVYPILRKYGVVAALFVSVIGIAIIWQMHTGRNKLKEQQVANVEQTVHGKEPPRGPNFVQKDSSLLKTGDSLYNELPTFQGKTLAANYHQAEGQKNNTALQPANPQHEWDNSSLTPEAHSTGINLPTVQPDQPHSNVPKDKDATPSTDMAIIKKEQTIVHKELDIMPTKAPRNKFVANGKWQIGILAGANLTKVKNDISNTPGVNAGIIVQRRINGSRVSIESGVIYENMRYAVANENFNPNGKPVSNKVSNISGTCTMIDVPVNVRYDMVHTKKRKAFVSTGVSPTIIVQQSYVYDYTDEKGTRLIDRDVTGKGKGVYPVANFSIGYEQKWDKTSVQVTPYIKIPMGEIGYGNLELGGLGTQITLKRDL